MKYGPIKKLLTKISFFACAPSFRSPPRLLNARASFSLQTSIYRNQRYKMADYWKSQPRKMCEYCKCWIADNKQSRDFHERGKKHQENVKKKIDELRKKGVKDAQKEAEMTDSLMAMEKAAMAALKKDLKHNPEMASQYGIKLKTEGSAQETKQSPQGTVAQSASTAQSDPGPVDVYLEHWHEATNPEGYVYYWNSETGESVWEKPKGYMTEAEREQQIAAAVVEATTEKMASSSAVTGGWSRKRKNPDDPGVPMGHHRGPRGLAYINDDKKRGSSLYTRKMSLVRKAIEFRNTTHKDVFIEMVTDHEHLIYGSPAMLERYNTSIKLTRTVQQRLVKENVPLPKEPLTNDIPKMLRKLPPVGGKQIGKAAKTGKLDFKKEVAEEIEKPKPEAVAAEDAGVVDATPLENGEAKTTETTPQTTPQKDPKQTPKTSGPKPCPTHRHGTRSKTRASLETGVSISSESSSPAKDDIPEGQVDESIKQEEDMEATIEESENTEKDNPLKEEEPSLNEAPSEEAKAEPTPCPSCGGLATRPKLETDDKSIQCGLIPVKPSYANKCRICNSRYFRKDKVSEWVGCAYVDNGQMCDYWVHVKCTGYNVKLSKTEMEVHFFCPQHIQ